MDRHLSVCASLNMIVNILLCFILSFCHSSEIVIRPGYQSNNDRPVRANDARPRHDVWIDQSQDAVFRHLALSAYQPRRRHLDRDRLMARMADDFDEFWMSIDRPLSNPVPRVEYKTTFNPSVDERITDYNFTYIDDNNTVMKLEEHERLIIERFLLQRATCPVYFTWMDLGIYFWPRWIRIGNCDQGQSCSWPPGMHCVPQQSGSVRVLTWQCRSTRKKKKRERNTDSPSHEAESNTARTYINRDIHKRAVYSDTDVAYESHALAKRSSHSKRNRNRKDPDIRCKWVKTRYAITPSCYCSC